MAQDVQLLRHQHENHDTIGILALDDKGKMAGGHHKRAGVQDAWTCRDSPILGQAFSSTPKSAA